jgi:hypothetical protein
MTVRNGRNEPDRLLLIMVHRRFCFVGICLWLLAVSFPAQIIAAPPTEEYKLKAALIYKLSKFVVWPDLAVTGDNGSFGICVLGEDPFGTAIDALEDRKTSGRSIRIHRFAQSEAVDRRCRILFVSESKRPFLRPILEKLRRLPILTVGDMNSFAYEGGMMQFTRRGNHSEFRINPQSAKQSGLEIAAPLLEIAEVVNTSKQQ